MREMPVRGQTDGKDEEPATAQECVGQALCIRVRKIYFGGCIRLHLPDAPQGRMRPLPVTGSPISSERTSPPRLFSSVAII